MPRMLRHLLPLLTTVIPLALIATPAQADTNDPDRVPATAGHAHRAAAQRLCPVGDLSVPESAGDGVATDWLAYGETLTVEPYADQIWAGVFLTGWNGPEGWTSTSAPSYYPAPGVPEYSLVARLGNGAYGYVGAADRTFTNTTPGYLLRVRFKVNDNTPGNGDGAFRVFLRYPCIETS